MDSKCWPLPCRWLEVMIPLLSSFDIESTGIVLSFSLASALVWAWDFILSFFRGYINFRTGQGMTAGKCLWSVTFVQPLHLESRDTDIVFAKIWRGRSPSSMLYWFDLYCCSPGSAKTKLCPLVVIYPSDGSSQRPFLVCVWTSRDSFMYSWSTDVFLIWTRFGFGQPKKPRNWRVSECFVGFWTGISSILFWCVINSWVCFLFLPAARPLCETSAPTSHKPAVWDAINDIETIDLLAWWFYL